MNYKVGQIFYLVGAETAKVIPFRIVEEVTRTTMKGMEKSFIAELPDKNNTTVDVEKLKGKVFKDTESLRTHMLNNASDAINQMIENAKMISSEAFQINESEAELQSPDVEKENNTTKKGNNSKSIPENGTVKVDIGNGIVANMKASDLEKVAQTWKFFYLMHII